MLQCDVKQADTLGTTALSVEEIGEITFEKDTKRVVMLMAQVVSTATMTTAEALMGKLIIDSKALGFNDFQVGVLINLGGAPATNIQAVDSPLLKIPIDKVGKFGNTKVKFRYDCIVPEPTSEVAAQCFAVYDDGSTPQLVIDALHRGYPLKVDHGERASDDEIGDALSEALDETMTFDGAYQTLVRYLADISPDAVFTAGEHFLGYLEFDFSFKGYGNQKWPLPAINAGLGTPVGSPVKVTAIDLPWHIPKGDGNETITPTAKIQQVTSGANAVQVSIGAQEAVGAKA